MIRHLICMSYSSTNVTKDQPRQENQNSEKHICSAGYVSDARRVKPLILYFLKLQSIIS